MTTNKSLNYYLSLAIKGDGKAAFKAAKIMRENKMNEVIIQTQLRRSASLGYAPAQRTLGILGICGLLVKPESTISHISYYTSFDPAIRWLRKAANNDSIAKYAMCKCMQLGLGVEKDEKRAEAMIQDIVDDLSMDTVVSLMFIFDSVVNSNKKRVPIDFRTFLNAG